MQFEWDPVKAAENIRNHEGVTFEEGQTVFADDWAITLPDPEHSEGEEQWIRLGYFTRQRLLVVCYTDRQGKTRIISARKATRKERRIYEN